MKNYIIKGFDKNFIEQTVYLPIDGALREAVITQIVFSEEDMMVEYSYDDQTKLIWYRYNIINNTKVYLSVEEYEGVEHTLPEYNVIDLLGYMLGKCNRTPKIDVDSNGNVCLHGHFVQGKVLNYLNQECEVISFNRKEAAGDCKEWICHPFEDPKHDTKFYDSKEEALWENDTEIVKQDGTTSIRPADKTPWELTEAQKEVITQIDALFAKAQELGLESYYDIEERQIMLFNRSNIQNFHNTYTDYQRESYEEHFAIKVPDGAWVGVAYNNSPKLVYEDEKVWIQLANPETKA